MGEKNPHFDFPENQRLLKLRDGTEVWAQTNRLGQGQVSLNLEIFPPHPDPFDEAHLKHLAAQLSQLALSRGWPAPQPKPLGRPTTIFFPTIPEGDLSTVKHLLAQLG